MAGGPVVGHGVDLVAAACAAVAGAASAVTAAVVAFAVDIPDSFTAGLTITAILTAIGGAATWIYARLGDRHRGAVQELGAIIDRLKADYTVLWQQHQDAAILHDRRVTELLDEARKAELQHEAEVRKVGDKYREILVQNQALRSELQISKSEGDRLRAGLNPLFASPQFWTYSVITADADGRVLEVNPGVNLLLHWGQEEMLAKNVRDIIPARYRAAHDAAMAAARARGGLSHPGKALLLSAITREGGEVPVEIYLDTYMTQDGLRCTAVLRRRWKATTEEPASIAELPVFVPGSPAPVPAPPPPASPPSPPPPEVK
jgi:PAS domain S-box-containing protein